MLNLSNEVFKALVKYLKGEARIADLRDDMVALRVEKYRLLAEADRLFLDEFEGRYAEFSEFGGDEASLKASLANYVQADEPSAVTVTGNSWSFPASKSSGSFSISVGSPKSTATFAVAVGQGC
jgi:hypothetical protein